MCLMYLKDSKTYVGAAELYQELLAPFAEDLQFTKLSLCLLNDYYLQTIIVAVIMLPQD